MYITKAQEDKLQWIIRNSEVALRSFISEIIIGAYPTPSSFKSQLDKITITDDAIYARRLIAKIKNLTDNHVDIHNDIVSCHTNFVTHKYNNNVPYVSFLIDLIMVFFNKNFSNESLIKKFPSVEEFHYSCSLYHKLRNNFSHPASYLTPISDANKTLTFIEHMLSGLDIKYFWYCTKDEIEKGIKEYKTINYNDDRIINNLGIAKASHKVLIGRDEELSTLYSSILGDDNSIRLAGSVVLYGYGGVGKTALTLEFLQKLLKDKKDGNYNNIDFILFYSSKDEYLKSNHSTGELYIDDRKPEFKNFNELQTLIKKDLNIDDFDAISEKYHGGIIAIDNIENLASNDKEDIFSFIKRMPRTIQFIITSRNEEPCEEKINIQEFITNDKGRKFIHEIIESEILNVSLSTAQTDRLLDLSKGNSLIIIQVLNSLHRRVVEFDTIVNNLASYNSKDAEIISNFMYKNTFDSAFTALEQKRIPVKDVVILISLYNEKIDLYSVSKLAKIDVPVSERLCNSLCERLILNKTGEFYELNEFAKRFVFIKLMPDRFQLADLKDKIKTHKEKIKKTLTDVDTTLNANRRLSENVNEWQPKNYIDKIIIAQTFDLYGKAKACVIRNDRTGYDKVLREMQEHSMVTNHPYVPVQFARILKDAYLKFHKNSNEILDTIEKYYEQAIESIEYDYRYLINTNAYYSLLMLYGIFLCERRKSYSMAIRYLEDARDGFDKSQIEPWFICSNYLSKSYLNLFKETNNGAYKDQLVKTFHNVKSIKVRHSSRKMNVSRYLAEYSDFIA